MLTRSNGDERKNGGVSFHPKMAQRPNDPKGTKIPFLVLTAFLFVGAALLTAAVLGLEEGLRKILAEHLGSAFIVSSVIGFTYEWLVHTTRDKWIKMFADEQRKATDEALNAFVALTPGEIFNLLRDIATRVGKTPTLYTPAREEGNEYTFASSINYFKSLVAVRRGEVIGVLREWIKEDSDPKLKFLASDFIGEFRLHELRDELEAQVRFNDWEKIDNDTKGWRLNFAWAASRSNLKNMYVSLAGMARKLPFEDVQLWILFIPWQMKDREFLKVINSYLRRDDLSPEKLGKVVEALGELHEADPAGVRNTFRKFRDKFNQEPVLKQIENTWGRHNLLPDPIITMIRKGKKNLPVAPISRER